MITTNNFGEFLKDLRLSKNLTLVELSKLSNVSQPHLSHIENGKRGVPSATMLKGLAKAFNMKYGELLLAAGLIDASDNAEIHQINEDQTEYGVFGKETFNLAKILKKDNIILYDKKVLSVEERALLDDFTKLLIKHRNNK